ncbi:unnamed protein product [Heterotrigona itama]|uniref:Uncharacterized protein n=1 Tax=Heterotrigona itama TaxID=395501 RepID=A0A6V7HJJ3_9HYME|nr:unnamed protein product [Heterotrigona itama]
MISETEQFDILACYSSGSSKGNRVHTTVTTGIVTKQGQPEHGRDSHQACLHNGRKIYSMEKSTQ